MNDDQTLREVHGLRPAPEFLEWCLQRGIFARDTGGQVVRGPHWGDPRPFCASEAEFQEFLAATPAAPDRSDPPLAGTPRAAVTLARHAPARPANLITPDARILDARLLRPRLD